MEFKTYKRDYYSQYMELLGSAKFINDGQFGDGTYSYSMVDDQGNVIDDTTYIQVRRQGKLVMVIL